MAWRDRLNVKESNAELTTVIELQKRHLLSKLKPMGTVILFTRKGLKVVAKEKVTKKMIEKARGYTIPDFLACTRNCIYPFYLDGPPHTRNGVKTRDERIDETLRGYGVEATRFSYKPPLPAYKLKEIVDRIQFVLTNQHVV